MWGGGDSFTPPVFALRQTSVTQTDDTHAHMNYDYVSFNFFPKHAELKGKKERKRKKGCSGPITLGAWSGG